MGDKRWRMRKNGCEEGVDKVMEVVGWGVHLIFFPLKYN